MNPKSFPLLSRARIVMASSILLTQGIGLYAGESSLWDARRDSARRLRSESVSPPSTAAGTLLAALPNPSPVRLESPAANRPASARDAVAALVAGHGWVREAHLSQRPGAPIVVHLQDAHGIEDAQRNLSVLVGRWAAANPGAPVALEGAAGPIDVDGLRNFPDRSLTADIAEFLLRRGLIAGPEHAALTLDRAPRLLGAEEDALYRQNIAALRAARMDTGASARLRQFQENIDRLERRFASPALREFDRRTRALDAGRSSLGDYVAYLSGADVPPGPPKPNMDALIKTLSLEKSLDFKAVEEQRRRLVEALVDRLPRAALDDLVSRGLDHRAGRLGPAGYHRVLRTVCRAHGIDLRRFAPLPAYIDYLERAETIDRAALLTELEARRRFVQDTLARTDAERALVGLSRDAALLEKIFAHALAPEEWRLYQTRRPGLLSLAARARALDPAADETEFSPAQLKPYEDFCSLALRRNDALSQQLLAAVAARNTGTGLLVAGGFHTDGLTALWRRQGVSYVVVAPDLREIPTENSYLDILARDPLPIEKMVAGERVTLSRPIALAEPGVVRTFYFALQRLLQSGLAVIKDAGVTVSRAPLRGGTAFQVGATGLFARFGDSSDRWTARARAWGRRWAENFTPAAIDRGGMMFWLPRFWNAATPKAWHVNARQYRFLSVPVEAGFSGLVATAITSTLGLPMDFDLFVRLSLAGYAAFHLVDFLTRDRRRAPFNGLMAGLIATAAGFLYALPAGWTAPVGITPAHAVYGVFLILHAAVNLFIVQVPRGRRPAPTGDTLIPAEAPSPPTVGVDTPRVTVLVLTHNDTADTIRLIDRMAAWPRTQKLPWDLVVVDNASTDAEPGALSDAVARVPGGRLLVNETNTGAAEGRNVGLRHLLERPAGERPDYVFLLDSDVRPTASTLEDLVATADASGPQRVAWAPPLYFESQPERVWRNWYHNVWRWPGQRSVDRGARVPAGNRDAVDGVATAAALVRLEAFENHGLFTPGYFFGNEDRDWCARVRKAGGEIAMAPVKEKILHNVHQSLEGNLYGNFSPVRTYYILRSMMLIFTYRSPLAERAVLRLTETGLTLFRVLRTAWRTRNPRVIGAAWAGLVDGVLGRDGVGRGPDFRTPAPVATPPALDAAFPLTVMEPAPEGVFRDRRAPAAPSPVATIPNGRRTETTGPAVFDPTPVNRPTTPPANPAALPTKFRPAAETTPSPAPRRPAARPPTPKPATEDELKERLVTALFSLSGALPRKSLVDFRVRNLRQQVDAFPAAGSFYPRLAAAWESGVERTVLLSSWGPRRSLRVPLGDLPIPIVVQGIHFLLEIRDGQPALVFANGKYLAPLDDTDTQPVLFGRDVMAQVTGTPELELLDFSQKHFRFWRNEGDVVIEDLSTNGTVVPIRRTNGVPYDERTHFAGTVDGTRFHSTRRHYLGGLLMGGLLLTALLFAPMDIASAATLIPLDGGGLKAIVEGGDSLWRILEIAEGGHAADILSRVAEVAQLNQLANPDLIFPGQEIVLRAAEAVPATVDVAPVVAESASAAMSAETLSSGGAEAFLDAVRRPANPAPWIAAGLGVALAGALAVGRARRARPRDFSPEGDTSFLDSKIQWDDVVDFQDPALPAPAMPKEVGPRLRSMVPIALTIVALRRWARRALTQSVHALWRAPLRAALGIFGAAENLAADLLTTPRRWRTRFEKRRADYDDPSTFFSHTRTGFGDPAGPEPANRPTRFRRFAATFYGWLTRRPLAVREVDLLPVADAEDDRLAVAATIDGTAALAIGPNDQPLGEHTVEPPPIAGKDPDLTLDALTAMHQEAAGDPVAAAIARADRGLALESGALAEKWQDEGLFTIPPPLLTYGDGNRVLIEIPFSRAAIQKVKRRLAAHKWLGVPLGKDLGYVLTSLDSGGWLRDADEKSAGSTPAHKARRLAALFRDGQSGAIMYDTPAEKLLVNIPAPAAWPFFFKLWWRGTREANPRGHRWTNRQEQTFFGPDTLRFPSGEPLVTQIEAAWGVDGTPRPQNIRLGALDAVAEYALVHFSQTDLSAFAGRASMNEDEAKRVLLESLREETRGKVVSAFTSAARRARELGAPTTVGLELSLALSWRMEDVAVGREIRQRLAPQIVLVRTALSDAAARTSARAVAPPRHPSTRSESAAGTLPGRWALAARTTLERLPFIGAPLANNPWLARFAGPLILAAALLGLPVWALAGTAPRSPWTPSEAVMTDQIPANLLKELSKSLPPGTDMAALLRGTDPATSARLLSGAVDLLRKFEGGRFLAVLEKTRPHVVLAPRGPEAAAAVDIRNKRPILYIGGAEAQPAYLFVALIHELSHLGRSDQLRAKKISPTQDEGLALEDTARAMEFYAGLSVVRIAYDQRQINEQRWIAHRFLDGTIKAAPHVLSPREVQLLTAPLRAAVHLAERRRYPGVIYVNSKNLGAGRYEVRFRLPQSGAEIVVDVTPNRVSAAPGGVAGNLAMLGGIVIARRGIPTKDEDLDAVRAALLRTLILGEAGPVPVTLPKRLFADGDNYWKAGDLEDLRTKARAATDAELAAGFEPTVDLLAGDRAAAQNIIDGSAGAALARAVLTEAGAGTARDADRRGDNAVTINLLGFDAWEKEEQSAATQYLAGWAKTLRPGATILVAADADGPRPAALRDAERRGVRVVVLTPDRVPALVNDKGQLMLAAVRDWVERENRKPGAAPLALGSRVIARNAEAVAPLDGFVVISVGKLTETIAREIEALRVLFTQA